MGGDRSDQRGPSEVGGGLAGKAQEQWRYARMISRLRITVIVENTAGGGTLLAEHGLALWVEADGRNILFDTGQGLALRHNVETLGINLAKADAVVLSHGHYDHAGGLGIVLDEAGERARSASVTDSTRPGRASPPSPRGPLTVYVHPRAFDAKYARLQDGTAWSIRAPIHDLEQVRSDAEVVTTAGPVKVADGVWVTGEIPRRYDFEDTGGPFFLDESCTRPDPLIDDQAMYLESPAGVIVLLGCGHAGLLNTLDYVAELTGGKQIHAVFGGFHLVHAADDRIARTVEALRRLEVRQIGPAHCTGRKATARIWESFPDRCVEFKSGSRFEFE